MRPCSPAVVSVVVDTAFGPLVATASEEALVGLRFCWQEPVAPAHRAGGGAIVELLREELAAYGSGEPMSFSVPLAWSTLGGFRHDVLRAAGEVPYGERVTYGQLAERAGRRGHARAVGGVLRANPWVIVVPCHRVVAADGSLTGFGGGPDTGGRLDVKAALLAHEDGWLQPRLF